MYNQPLYPLAILLVMLGLVRAWWRPGAEKPVLATGSFAVLFLLSWPPFTWLMLQPFERPFPHTVDTSTNPQAIVVLASGIQYPTVPGLPVARLGSDTFERCQYGAFLFKRFRSLPVLVTGKGNLSNSETPPYALLMKEAMEKEGVPGAMIWSESESHTTHENAANSAKLLHEKGITRILLVTDAYHMRRSALSFKKEGLEVIPAACAYRAVGIWHVSNLAPTWESIGFNEDLFHEVVGLAWYKVHGWV